ncbi:hypothetical protein IT570_11650 [Candidatus Sumerlaeota bacterium]|nr:hypothetical protein [Candidatus Sumerlaeota bacterium]
MSGRLVFRNPFCGSMEGYIGDIPFPQIFTWKFIAGGQQVVYAGIESTSAMRGVVRDVAADFRSAPTTPPPRIA